MQKTILITLAFILAAASFAAGSATVITSQVAVETRDSGNERQALRAALGEAIITLTGDQAASQGRVAKRLKKRLDEFLLEFRYELLESGWALVAQFDQDELLLALDQEGLATRQVSQEEVMLWLVYQVPGRDPLIINTSSPGKLRETLRKIARSRGLQLVLPIMDLDDRRQVNPAAILAGRDNILTNASRRYGVHRYVTGQLQYEAGRWNAGLRSDRSPDNASSQSARLSRSFAAALTILQSREQAMDQVQTELANSIIIQVAYVGSYSAYKRLKKYFDASRQIASWTVQSNQGDTTIIELELSVSAKRWLDTLRGDGVLERTAAPVDTQDGEIGFFFSLLQ